MSSDSIEEKIVDALNAIGSQKHVVVWAIREDGFLVFASENYKQVTGVEAHELYGHMWEDRIDPEHVQAVNDAREKSIALGIPWSGTCTIVSGDGTRTPIIFYGSPVVSESDGLSYWIGVSYSLRGILGQ